MAEQQEDIMGQYQQWLRYREIERQLHMQVESLEAELAELQARARSLEETDSRVDGATGNTADTGDTDNNELLRLLSLAMRLDAHASPGESKPTPANSAASSSPAFINKATGAGKPAEPAEQGAGESFSPTLFPWGSLPDFGPQEMPAAAQQPIFEWTSPSSSSSSPSPLPQPGIELLPEDMAAFFDEHSQTDPQLELPWWQHQQEAIPTNMHSSSPIDQQDLRNKHEIERWLERWRRQSAQPFQRHQSENQGDTQHE